MYPVQTEFLCNHHANELTKFIKNSEKIHRFSFDHSPSIYIISRSNLGYLIDDCFTSFTLVVNTKKN
jgi:hypothetical protein